MQLHLNKLRIACAVLLTVGCRSDVHQSSRVQALAARVVVRTYSERVRQARCEASDVVCRRVRARVRVRVHFVIIRVRTRPVELNPVVGDVAVRGRGCSPRQVHRERRHGHGGEARWS